MISLINPCKTVQIRTNGDGAQENNSLAGVHVCTHVSDILPPNCTPKHNNYQVLLHLLLTRAQCGGCKNVSAASHVQRGSCAEFASGPPSQLKAAPILAPFVEMYSCAETMRASTAVAFETRLTRSRSHDAPCAMACVSRARCKVVSASLGLRWSSKKMCQRKGGLSPQRRLT